MMVSCPTRQVEDSVIHSTAHVHIGVGDPWGDFVCLLRLRNTRLTGPHDKPLFPTDQGGGSQLVRVGSALGTGALVAFHTRVWLFFLKREH